MGRPVAASVGHLLFARCSPDHGAVTALGKALIAARDDPGMAELTRLSSLDLDLGPRLNRARTLIGLGWQARDIRNRIEVDAGTPLDAIIEVCVCGAHHLLGLGRVGIPTVRWHPEDGPDWLDRLARDEGAMVLDDAPPTDEEEGRGFVVRLFAHFEAARLPPPSADARRKSS